MTSSLSSTAAAVLPVIENDQVSGKLAESIAETFATRVDELLAASRERELNPDETAKALRRYLRSVASAFDADSPEDFVKRATAALEDGEVIDSLKRRFLNARSAISAATGNEGLSSFHGDKIHMSVGEYERLIGLAVAAKDAK